MSPLSPVSFIVPAFNAAETLEETIASVLDGNLLEGDEIVIVDDGSSDSTRDLAWALAQSNVHIRLVQHQHNRGSANAARNTGIDHASNDFLFNLDADNVLLPGSVGALRRCMDATGADAVAFGEIEYFETGSGRTTHSWIMRPEITFIGNINAMTESPGGSGNFLYRRDAWLRAGRCTESVGAAWDSWAFSTDLLGTGSKFVCLPGTRYRHRTGYDSSFIRDQHKRNLSLLLLQVLIPHLHLIHPDDVDYLMSPEGRTSWVDQLAQRPLRGRLGDTGPARNIVPPGPQSELPAGLILKMLGAKVKRRLPGLRQSRTA